MFDNWNWRDLTYIIDWSGELTAVLDTNTHSPLRGRMGGQRTIICNIHSDLFFYLKNALQRGERVNNSFKTKFPSW